MRLFEISQAEFIVGLPNTAESEVVNFAKKVVKGIRRNCKPYLNELQAGNALYRGMQWMNSASTPFRNVESPYLRDMAFVKKVRKDRIIRDVAKDLTQTLNQIFEMHHSPVRRENALFAYGTKPETFYGQAYIIFPIGEIDYIWSDKVKDPFLLRDDKDLYDLNKEKFEKRRREDEKEETEYARMDLYTEVKQDIEREWYDHFYSKAADYYDNLPENDPDKYGQSQGEMIQDLTRKWMTHHEDEMKKKIKEQVEINLHSEEVQKRIQKTVSDNLSFILHATGDFADNMYYDLNTDKVIDKFASSYHTGPGNLNVAIASENEIMVRCERYYALDEDFYELFVKDKLWR